MTLGAYNVASARLLATTGKSVTRTYVTSKPG